MQAQYFRRQLKFTLRIIPRFDGKSMPFRDWRSKAEYTESFLFVVIEGRESLEPSERQLAVERYKVR